MTRTFKMLLGWAVASASLFAPGAAQAFCVANNAGGEFRIDATVPGGLGHGGNGKQFSENVSKGDNKCCNWQNSDCNPTKKQNAIVGMYVNICSTGGLNTPETRPWTGGSTYGLYGEPAGNPPCHNNNDKDAHTAPMVCGLTGNEINNIAAKAHLPTVGKDQTLTDRIVMVQAGGWLELTNINGVTVMKSFLTDGKVMYTFPCYGTKAR